MHWLSLGLASSGLYAGISIADKVILERFFKNRWAYPFFTAIFLGLFCLVILIIRQALGSFQPPSVLSALLALLPGLLHYAAALTFTRALLQADASTVSGIAQVSPIFGAMWGVLFLGEWYSPLNYFGILLLVGCAILLAWEKPVGVLMGPDLIIPQGKTGRGRLNRALWLVLLGALLRSLSDLFTKVAVTDLAFWDAFSLSRLGMLLPALLVLLNPSVRSAVVDPVKRNGVRVIWKAGCIEVFAMFNLLLITAAYARGPLALVSATQSSGPLFILLLTGLVNRFRPGFVPVKDNDISGWTKVALSTGLMAGVFFLSFRA